MWNEELKSRALPALQSREEMLALLQREEYGFLPPKSDKIEWIPDESFRISHFCAGKATIQKINAVCRIGQKTFSFPFCCTLPAAAGKHPFFIFLNFRASVPDRYLPAEELIDHGFAVLSFCYEDITADNADFTSGLAGVLYENGKRGPADAGKIALWAWAAQRVMDYAETRADVLDLNRAVVCGHSRLGKTALLTGATDPRFRFVYSNDSGCGGAALFRHKQGETAADLCRVFPFWFCKNFQKYAGREEEMPFDQHFLLSAVAPRFVCVGSAENDAWADPASEMLTCIAASPAFGAKGFRYEDRKIAAGDRFLEGAIGYHLRKGDHYFSREDWHRLMEFVQTHTGEN